MATGTSLGMCLHKRGCQETPTHWQQELGGAVASLCLGIAAGRCLSLSEPPRPPVLAVQSVAGCLLAKQTRRRAVLRARSVALCSHIPAAFMPLRITPITQTRPRQREQGGLPQIMVWGHLGGFGGRTGLRSNPRVPIHQLCVLGRVTESLSLLVLLCKKGTIIAPRTATHLCFLRGQFSGFSTFTVLCNHNLCAAPEHFYHPKKTP